ncbi:MAG: hypothetical protein ABEN55_03140 [Bradymonadaceae bacterium]
MRIDRRHLTTLGIALCLLGAAGCASSQSADAGDGAEASSSRTTTESADAADTSGKTKAVQKRVHFEEILGTTLTAGEKPTGCYGDWEPIDKGRYPGDGYFCSKFNGPKKWGDIPVTFTIQNGKLSVIAVQIFFDGPSEARDEYQKFSGNLLDRCSRKTGFDQNIVLDCKDYFVDVAWQGQQTGRLEVIYALNFDDLPK